MPAVRESGQRGQRIVKAGGVGEHGDAAQKTVAHEKGEQGLLQRGPADPGIYKQDIHGDAAQLEREVPPVVLSAAQDEGEGELFPDLAGEHEEAADQEKNVGFPVPHMYLLPSRAAVCFDPAYIIAQSHGYLYENSIW